MTSLHNVFHGKTSAKARERARAGGPPPGRNFRPLMDRIDLPAEIPVAPYKDLRMDASPLSCAVMRERMPAARALTRALRRARTLADRDGDQTLTVEHPAKAVNLRNPDRRET